MYDLYMIVIILYVGYVGIFIFCKFLVILGYFINRCKFYFCSEFICFELFFIVENFFKYIDWGNMVDIVGFF